MPEEFVHPRRFPANAPGAFYTTGHPCTGTGTVDGMIGDCLQCEAPEAEAPELLAPLNDDNLNTYFVRQPYTAVETEHACNAIRVCCVCALRYGGTDRSIITKLGNNPEHSDYILDGAGALVRVVGTSGDLLPFAQAIVVRIRESYASKNNG